MRRDISGLKLAMSLIVAALLYAGSIPAETQPAITTVAGNGTQGYSGDGGPATDASLNTPYGVAVDPVGNLIIADTWNHRIRRVDAASGVITTVAGNDTQGYGGDGGPATAAMLNAPQCVVVDGVGNLFVADTQNHRIRRVDGTTGTITTVAGNGLCYLDDGVPATSTGLCYPYGVTVDASGNLFIADTWHGRIRRVDAGTGTISTVAGSGDWSVGGWYGGDGGPAVSAGLDFPTSVAVDEAGDLYIADARLPRIRRVDATSGVITTVAGNGGLGFSGDDGPATSASLSFPHAVVLDASDNLLIADSWNSRIRRVDPATGIITTVLLSAFPLGLALDPSGDLVIAETYAHRIRRAPGVVDSTPPVVTPDVSGTLGSNGWYVGNVSVSWTVTDAESPVSSTSGCETAEATTDTTETTFTCAATSGGGTATQSVTIKRDATLAQIVITVPRLNHNLLQNERVAAQYSCSDALAGVQSVTGTVPNGQLVDTLALGIKVFNVTCVDLAGNSATLTRPYTVITVSGGIAELIALVRAFNLTQGIENSLDAKLQNAQAALEDSNAGRRLNVVNKLQAFLNEVQAQRGKAITEEQAALLLALTNRIIAVLTAP